MRSKKELIVLLLVIAAAAAYLLSRQQDRLTYELPQLEKIDTQTVMKMTVTRPAGELLLEKKEGQWQLMPHGYPADATKIDAMLTTIGNLTVTTVVAEKSSDARYDLDPDHRLEVKAWDENKIVRQFSLGKAADTFRHTFVKLPDDNRIFHAKDNFRDRFDFTVAGLRSKQVLTFDPDEIISIQVARNDQTFEWMPIETKSADGDEKEKKTDSVVKEWKAADEKEADHTKLNQLLDRLAGLNCQSYLEPEDSAVSTPPVWSIDLKTTATSYSFTIYPEITKEEEKLWPATASMVADPFLLADWQTKDIAEIVDYLTMPQKIESDKETLKESS